MGSACGFFFWIHVGRKECEEPNQSTKVEETKWTNGFKSLSETRLRK